MSDADTFQIKGLESLIKALSDPRAPVACIGVLGNKSARGGGPTNADVGAAHEFGAPSRNLSIRSWLRAPLISQMQNAVNRAGATRPQVIQQILKEGTFRPWVEKIGILGLSVVAEGFNTGGFGEWPPSNMDRKAVKQTLVETQQLRNSATYEVR